MLFRFVISNVGQHGDLDLLVVERSIEEHHFVEIGAERLARRAEEVALAHHVASTGAGGHVCGDQSGVCVASQLERLVDDGEVCPGELVELVGVLDQVLLARRGAVGDAHPAAGRHAQRNQVAAECGRAQYVHGLPADVLEQVDPHGGRVVAGGEEDCLGQLGVAVVDVESGARSAAAIARKRARLVLIEQRHAANCVFHVGVEGPQADQARYARCRRHARCRREDAARRTR